MAQLLRRLLNLKANEWPRFLLLYVTFFAFVVGITWAENSLYGAVLEQGVELLPRIQIASAIVAIALSAIYAAFVDRISHDKLLIAITLVSIVAIALGVLLLVLNRAAAFPLLYLLQWVIDNLIGLHWWTYAISFYDTRSAKRITPLLASAGRVGAATAGFSYRILTGPLSLTPGGIALIWIGSLTAVTLLTWIMSHYRKTDRPPVTITSRQQSYAASLGEGYRYVSSSSFLRWMAISALLLIVITRFLEYQAGLIFRQEFAGVENVNTAISNFTADLTGITNLLMLLVQLFFFNRLVGWLGLGNSNLLYPLATLGVAGSLIFLPYSLLTGALAHFNRTSFRQVFRSPVDNLLFNAVPLRVKGRARALINGLIVPIGILIAGGLLSVAPSVPLPWFLPAVLGIAAVAYAVTAIVLRRKYAEALVQTLEQEDFSFLLSQPSELAITDPATLKWLAKRVDDSKSDSFTIFLAGIMVQAGGKDALPLVSEIARKGNAQVRAAVLDAVVAADIPGDAAYTLYTEFLTDADGRVRRACVAGLAEALGDQHEEFLSLTHPLLHDPEMSVRTLVIPPLVCSGVAAYRDAAQTELNQILADERPSRRAQGVRLLGQLGSAQALTTYVADPADEVRLEAVLAFESLSKGNTANTVAEYFLANHETLFGDTVERIRQAALEILRRVNTPEGLRAVARSLADPSTRIRQVVADILVSKGQQALPLLTPALDAPNPQLRTTAVVALSRIDRETYGHLISRRIEEGLQTIYQNYRYLEALSSQGQYSSIGVLQNALRERIRTVLSEIFYLMTALHDPEKIQVIYDALKSETATVRSNAVEALESLTSPQIARELAPLFDPEMKPARLVNDHQRQILGPRQAIKELLFIAGEPWLRAITAFALGEIGAAVSSTSPIVAEDQRDVWSITVDPDEAILDKAEISELLSQAVEDPALDVRHAAEAARLNLQKVNTTREAIMLSTIEKIIFLKEVSFFQNMSVDQLKILADICEEEIVEEGDKLFDQGSPGGALYVIVNGRIGIGMFSKRSGAFTQLAAFEPRQAFGEMSLFDHAPRSAAAIALQHSLLLRVRREPLIALARQSPDLSLELISVLAQRLRQANEQIASLSSSLRKQLE